MCVLKYSSRTCARCGKEPANNSEAVSACPPRRFPPPWSVEELTSADTTTARVYDSEVGPGPFPLIFLSGSTTPTMLMPLLNVLGICLGRQGKAAGFGHFRRFCCERCGCAMDTRSDFAETDLHFLTFDIPDDALERADGAERAFTWVHCTGPLAWESPAVGDGQSGS
jgi:hypothetical protein